MEPAVQATFNFAKDGALLQPHLAPLTADAVTRDEGTWLAYLDALPQVSKTAKLGVVGFCMGGPRVVQASALRLTAWALPWPATPVTVWSPTSPTARTCWRPRSRPRAFSPSPRTTPPRCRTSAPG
ncbi:MAG: dienelactone hydrolase family protein [Caulobacteraceae bacterium]